MGNDHTYRQSSAYDRVAMDDPHPIDRRLEDVLMTPCQNSSTDSRSESGYNSAASSGSLSDQVGHVVDVTVAALELINGSPSGGAPDESEAPMFYYSTHAYDGENAKPPVACFLTGSRGCDDAGTSPVRLTSLVSRLSSELASDPTQSGDGNRRRVGLERRPKVGQHVNDDNDQDNDIELVDVADKGHHDEHSSAIKRSINTIETNGKRSSRVGIRTVNDKRNRAGRKEGEMAKYDTDSNMKRGQNVSKENITRPPPHVLPPCKVCGIQATGFHYGVNTCEACKVG